MADKTDERLPAPGHRGDHGHLPEAHERHTRGESGEDDEQEGVAAEHDERSSYDWSGQVAEALERPVPAE